MTGGDCSDQDHGDRHGADEALGNALQRFDEWFRYAETVGQQRLNGYLFTVSITLASFATLYARDIFTLSLVVAVFGVLFSFGWGVVGFRQTRFHRMIEEQIDLLTTQDQATAAKFPIYYVRQLKNDVYASKKRIILSKWEHRLATRNFLFLVPAFFCVLYVICSMFAVRRAIIMFL